MVGSVVTEQQKDLKFERRMALRYVQYTFSSHCSLYISHGTDKENLFNNQELL